MKTYRKQLLLILCTLLTLGIYSCDPSKGAYYKEKKAEEEASVPVNPDEEYIMITTIVNFPMYVNHDQAAFIKWGKRRGVRTTVLGPSEWDVASQISFIEQVIPSKPAGLLINGTDPAIANAINMAVDAGIPTVVYDSDIVNSKRHAFLGTDWYEIGRWQGEAMVEMIGGKGQIAYMGIIGLANMEAGFQGLLDVLKDYPEIEVVGKYDDKANVEEAARITSDLISANPDLVGICGFDAMSGPGIGLAVKEAGKVGKIKITTVDTEPEHLKLVRDGVIQTLVGQKRELFTWYGAQFLYDMVHKPNTLSGDDEKAGITNIPFSVNTGLFKIDKTNIDLFESPN
ncbi:MAG: substrate-binding domain-containing protein [Flammeovirgaceae bacterium]|nr:substrate-binding domain-containing protein [Flammeovirgaceae bacterium]